MAILAANCPCCGRDIGFEEGTKEYTCIFCGAKLITATLVKERLDSNANRGYERYRKGDALDEMARPRIRQPFIQPAVTVTPAEKPEEQPSKEQPPKEQPAAPAKQPEPELTEEEIRVQLMRKAEFKQELRDVVKEIDTLRSRRERFTYQLKTCRVLMTIGLVFIAAAAAVMIVFGNNEEMTRRFVIAGALAALGLLSLILSEVKKNGVKKQQKKHERTIEEKKEKRDVLIGRLNKINKRLHIHDSDDEGHGD